MEQKRLVFNKREKPSVCLDDSNPHLCLKSKHTVTFHQRSYHNRIQELQLNLEGIKNAFFHYFFAKKAIVNGLKNKSEYITNLRTSLHFSNNNSPNIGDN